MAQLELLAPAGNLTLGMAAVDHGADAVYIGAERFGARAAAGNPVRDIQQLCDYAHFYRARVYVALNTLLFDHELEAARKLIFQLWDAGADALIIQDMGLLELDLPPIPLFASTQTDNRSPEKVNFLEQSGFQRVILARELGLDAIAGIRAATSVDLEAFVHGALCVCYSGQCYMSAAIGGRSANRGACGQPCRLPWNLVTARGRVLAKDRYLLCLKDMDRSAHLAALAAAGVTSFKIEGRLKDLAYVKNVTAYYRQKLDALIQEDFAYEKASAGRTVFSFAPDPAKTFSRGATDYLLTGPDTGEIHAMASPKSRGEYLGKADRIGPDWFTLRMESENRGLSVGNGDGLCFVDEAGGFRGFRVNRADRDGRLYPPGRTPMKAIPLKSGMPVFRNFNQAFSKSMAGDTAKRRIGVVLEFEETSRGIALDGTDEDGVSARVEMPLDKETAKNPDKALAALKKQLGRLGNTPFEMTDLAIRSRPLFVQAGVLNELRRQLVGKLMKTREAAYVREERDGRPEPVSYPGTELDFRGNVANSAAKRFYRKRGVGDMAPAFEIAPASAAGPVMTTRHCIRRALGHCPGDRGKRRAEQKHSDQRHPDQRDMDWQGPLFLENEKGRFQVEFDCAACEMNIFFGRV